MCCVCRACREEGLCCWPAAIGVIVLSLLFGGVVLAIYPGWDSIGNFLNNNLKLSDKAPDWVQAVGSIGAIIFAGHFVRWQVRENKRISDRQQEDLKKKKRDNVICVLKDELDYIKININGFDNIFEKRYQKHNARRRDGFFKPRPLNPMLLEEVISEYYSDYSSKERLAIKSILTLYPLLNSYADRCENHNKKKSEYINDLTSTDLKNEVVMAMFYIKTGLIYYYTLKGFIEGGEVPMTAEKDQQIIEELHENLNLKIDLDFIIWKTWKYDKLSYEGGN
jgi:hypothetical protein